MLKHSGFSVNIIDGLATSKSRIIDLPLEMAYLKSYYGKPDISPFALFHHFKHFGYSFEYIGKKVRESGAFLVGISSLFTAYSDMPVKTALAVKRFHPGCKIVLGGHHPTFMPEKAMECEAVDFVIRGEGEVSMPMLARVVKGADNLKPDAVPGIVFRKCDGTLRISEPAFMDNPDLYPLPATELVKHSFYKRNKRGSTVVVASRGCPMKCSYCALGSSVYRYRRRSVDSVIREIKNAVTQHNAGFIDFEDENLSLDREWFLNLLLEINMKFKGLRLELRAMNGLFPPTLDEQTIKMMKEAGFRTLNLSLGSTSEDQLRKFHRPDPRKSLENIFALAEKYGLEAVCYIIAGAPGQRAEDSVADLLYLARKKAIAGISVFYPAPGSADFELSERSGILPSHLSLMRSSALPISHTTTRVESVTILRLGRILNFMKSLLDDGLPIPAPLPYIKTESVKMSDRRETGMQLLQWFLHDGKIRGVTPDGTVFEHNASTELTRKFIKGLEA